MPVQWHTSVYSLSGGFPDFHADTRIYARLSALWRILRDQREESMHLLQNYPNTFT